jgi:Ca2+/H+ antiporter
MMEISDKLGISALTDPSYLYNQRMNLFFGALQCLILMTTVFISIFKPWKKKKWDS